MNGLKDIKEALSSARKADTTHVRQAFQIYTARPCEYGSEKYERANYMRPTGDDPHTEPTKADFERLRAYLRAARGHIDDVLESMERHQAHDPQLLDVEGMKVAAYAVDTDAKPGQKIGASMLPHVAPACASLMMAITQATDCGLLPKDPGTPWRQAAFNGAMKEFDSALAPPREEVLTARAAEAKRAGDDRFTGDKCTCNHVMGDMCNICTRGLKW